MLEMIGVVIVSENVKMVGLVHIAFLMMFIVP